MTVCFFFSYFFPPEGMGNGSVQSLYRRQKSFILGDEVDAAAEAARDDLTPLRSPPATPLLPVG